MSRLDVPTFNDPAVQGQLNQALPDYMRGNVAFRALTTALRVLSTTVQLLSQLSVLLTLLKDQPDGFLLAFLSFAHGIYSWSNVTDSFEYNPGSYSPLAVVVRS